jgi:hypothetical protein
MTFTDSRFASWLGSPPVVTGAGQCLPGADGDGTCIWATAGADAAASDAIGGASSSFNEGCAMALEATNPKTKPIQRKPQRILKSSPVRGARAADHPCRCSVTQDRAQSTWPHASKLHINFAWSTSLQLYYQAHTPFLYSAHLAIDRQTKDSQHSYRKIGIAKDSSSITERKADHAIWEIVNQN